MSIAPSADPADTNKSEQLDDEWENRCKRCDGMGSYLDEDLEVHECGCESW